MASLIYEQNILTHYLKISLATAHRISVYLAHIPSSINVLYIAYMKVPRPMVVI